VKTKLLARFVILISLFQQATALSWRCGSSNISSSYLPTDCKNTATSNAPVVDSYNFGSLSLSDFKKTGSWMKTADGISSSSGLLFVDLNRAEYSVTTTAALGTGLYTGGLSGGYGVLFDTSLDENNKDTGFALQFDRAYNAVIIRPRIAGVESSPVLVVRNRDNSAIPSSQNDPWWTQKHEIKLDVKKSATITGVKTIDVWVGGVKVISGFSFANKSNAESNFTGLRSWGAGTTYNTMEVK